MRSHWVSSWSVVSGFIDTETKACGATRTSNREGILAIVPVPVIAKKGVKVMTMYAFLDPGSTATFCMEELMKQLNMAGKEIMGVDKIVQSQKPEAFSQGKILASNENIPPQEDLDK